jgi:CHAT domain
MKPGPAARRTRPASTGDVLELFVLAAGPASEPALILASFRNARVLEPFPRRGGEAGARWQRIIHLHERTLRALDGRGGELPTGKELRALGRDLFETLLPGDVRRLYDVARSLQPDRVLDVVFTSMIDWVADKPWELAYDPGRREFLATASVNFVRNVFTAVPADATRRRGGRLRILVASARPHGTAPVSTRKETADLRRAFRTLTDEGLADVEVLQKATPGRLQRRLADGGVDVFHFVGHGDFDEETREGSVLLQDERGRPRPVGFDLLRQIVVRRGLRLVFLNACETGRGGRVDWNRGVAPALVAAGVPAVVANQYAVLDSAATAFARDFYAQLARGRSLGDAAREARVAVGRDVSTGTIDWAVPVLFARDPRETLR